MSQNQHKFINYLTTEFIWDSFQQFENLNSINCMSGTSFRKLIAFCIVLFLFLKLWSHVAIKFYMLKFLAFGHCRNVKRAGGWWSEMPNPIASSPSRGWPCSRRPRWVCLQAQHLFVHRVRTLPPCPCWPWFLPAFSRWSLTSWPQPLVPTTTLCTSWVTLTWDVTRNTNSAWT